MLASSRDGKYIEAIEKITGNKLARREMMDIEVREERKSSRGEHGRGGPGRGGNRDKDKRHRDRRPPGGKFHDQVAGIEPAQTSEVRINDVSAVVTSAPSPAIADAPRPQAVVPEQKRREHRPHENKPHNERPRPPQHDKPQHEKHPRGGSQRQHNERAAQSEAVDKSQLPAFLFRPVPVKKLET
jgi:hypothetical protein